MDRAKKCLLLLAAALLCGNCALSANLYVNCGGQSGKIGNVNWASDNELASPRTAGAYTSLRPVSGGAWKDVYNTHRFSSQSLTYSFDAPAGGVFDVVLQWAETYPKAAAEGRRVFDVLINDAPLPRDAIRGQKITQGVVDVFKLAGGLDKPLYVKVDNVQPRNGRLTIKMSRSMGSTYGPMISGVMIKNSDNGLKSEAGVVGGSEGMEENKEVPEQCQVAFAVTGTAKNRFMMNVGGPAVSTLGFGADNPNYIVEADKGFAFSLKDRAQISAKRNTVFQSHRYTLGPSLTYRIPVPPGMYYVRLLVTETYFSNPGQRLFNIFINGALKKSNVDAVKEKGKLKPLHYGFRNITAEDGHVTIKLAKVKQNPILSGIIIRGTGADADAIAGHESGTCHLGEGKPAVSPSPSPLPDEQHIAPGYDHVSHAVPGAPYIVTDFSGSGKATVTLDGTLSHSHYQSFGPPPVNGKIVKYTWSWKDSRSPDADEGGRVVKDAPSGKLTAAFPLGKTTVELEVVDNTGDAHAESTYVEVKSAAANGALCYFYDYGKQLLGDVPLSIETNSFPKPSFSRTVKEVNFPKLADFGEFKFRRNSFAVRCDFYLNVRKSGLSQYHFKHSGPMKAYSHTTLMASSTAKSAQSTMTRAAFFRSGQHHWQVLYVRNAGTKGSLSFKDGAGAVVGGSSISFDSGAALPIILGVSKTHSSPRGGENIQIVGSSFINGVSVLFGDVLASNVIHSDQGSLQVTIPKGSGEIDLVIKTRAGTSNSVKFQYRESDQSIQFTTDRIRTENGQVFKPSLLTSARYGPDGRLYLASTVGKLYALTLNADFVIEDMCTKTITDRMPRSILGLAFDPSDPTLTLYFTTSTTFWEKYVSEAAISFEQGWTNGKVQSITLSPGGCFSDTWSDVVTGLPATSRDHSVNKLHFLPDGRLLITVGGFTNGGDVSSSALLGGVPENPLSGSIVVCPKTKTKMVYTDYKDPGNARVRSGDCRVYASGLRNSFGMWFHSNKKLYATDNGPNKAFGNFAIDCNGGTIPGASVPDKLFLVEPGKCHGHPNKNRGQCVYNDPRCVKPMIGNLESATTGVVEYRSNTFSGQLKGNLFLSKFATAKNRGAISRVVLGSDGALAAKFGFSPHFYSESGLDIVEGPRGELIMPRVYLREVLVVKPAATAVSKTFLIGVHPKEGPATGGVSVLVSGYHFGSTPTATFGGRECRVSKVMNGEAFYCITPPAATDTLVSVIVTGESGKSRSFGTDYWYY